MPAVRLIRWLKGGQDFQYASGGIICEEGGKSETPVSILTWPLARHAH